MPSSTSITVLGTGIIGHPTLEELANLSEITTLNIVYHQNRARAEHLRKTVLQRRRDDATFTAGVYTLADLPLLKRNSDIIIFTLSENLTTLLKSELTFANYYKKNLKDQLTLQEQAEYPCIFRDTLTKYNASLIFEYGKELQGFSGTIIMVTNSTDAMTKILYHAMNPTPNPNTPPHRIIGLNHTDETRFQTILCEFAGTTSPNHLTLHPLVLGVHSEDFFVPLFAEKKTNHSYTETPLPPEDFTKFTKLLREYAQKSLTIFKNTADDAKRAIREVVEAIIHENKIVTASVLTNLEGTLTSLGWPVRFEKGAAVPLRVKLTQQTLEKLVTNTLNFEQSLTPYTQQLPPAPKGYPTVLTLHRDDHPYHLPRAFPTDRHVLLANGTGKTVTKFNLDKPEEYHVVFRCDDAAYSLLNDHTGRLHIGKRTSIATLANGTTSLSDLGPGQKIENILEAEQPDTLYIHRKTRLYTFNTTTLTLTPTPLEENVKRIKQANNGFDLIDHRVLVITKHDILTLHNGRPRTLIHDDDEIIDCALHNNTLYWATPRGIFTHHNNHTNPILRFTSITHFDLLPQEHLGVTAHEELRDETLTLWDLTTQKPLRTFIKDHPAPVKALTLFSDHGESYLFAITQRPRGSDSATLGKAYLWDVRRCYPVATYETGPHSITAHQLFKEEPPWTGT